MSAADLNQSDFKSSKSKWIVPIWLDIFLFLLLCGVVTASVLLALVKASTFLGFAILWGGALALAGIRFGVKRALIAWS